jgi:hypothetical protein
MALSGTGKRRLDNIPLSSSGIIKPSLSRSLNTAKSNEAGNERAAFLFQNGPQSLSFYRSRAQ